MGVSTWMRGGVVLPFRPYLQGTVLQTAIVTAYIRARLHAVSAYPVIDRSPRLAVASSRRFFLFHTFGRRFNTIILDPHAHRVWSMVASHQNGWYKIRLKNPCHRYGIGIGKTKEATWLHLPYLTAWMYGAGPIPAILMAGYHILMPTA